jgi:hypothetical protein
LRYFACASPKKLAHTNRRLVDSNGGLEFTRVKRFFSAAAILGLGACLCLGLNAWARSQDEAGLQDEAGSTQHQQQIDDTQSARPFQGRIARPANSKDGKLVLEESSTGQFYSLDNQQAAKPFFGKEVKIIAAMDPKTNTLHIIDIRPAPTEK